VFGNFTLFYQVSTEENQLAWPKSNSSLLKNPVKIPKNHSFGFWIKIGSLFTKYYLNLNQISFLNNIITNLLTIMVFVNISITKSSNVLFYNYLFLRKMVIRQLIIPFLRFP